MMIDEISLIIRWNVHNIVPVRFCGVVLKTNGPISGILNLGGHFNPGFHLTRWFLLNQLNRYKGGTWFKTEKVK